jgi:hypothetical protein
MTSDRRRPPYTEHARRGLLALARDLRRDRQTVIPGMENEYRRVCRKAFCELKAEVIKREEQYRATARNNFIRWGLLKP